MRNITRNSFDGNVLMRIRCPRIVGFLAPGLLTTALVFGWGIILANAAASNPVFSLTVSPEVAFSGDTITARVTGANFTLASTTFAWFRDGVKLAGASGLGKSLLIFSTAAANGSPTVQISVEVDPGSGFNKKQQSKTISLLPSAAALGSRLSAATSEFSLEASKITPNPGELVTVDVVTFSFDKISASYRWFVDDAFQESASGLGQSQITVPGARDGEERVVRVEVTTSGGQGRSHSLTIQTTSAPMYWWADTAIPYWYKGKALPSVNSIVTFLALPNVPQPQALIYNWEFDASPMTSASGWGRQSFSITMKYPLRERIDVSISDATGGFSKTLTTFLKPFPPEVGIYELRPLRGLAYEKQIANFRARAGDPYDFAAEPFFFTKEITDKLMYRWTFNGKPTENTAIKPWLFTLQSKSGESSVSAIDVNVSEPKAQGQRANASTQVSLE